MKLIITGSILMFLLLHNICVFAQDTTRTEIPKPLAENGYKTAFGIQFHGIGLALVNPKGLTIKHFVSSRSALEFNLTPGGRNIIGSNLAVLRHFPVLEAPRLQWYAGAGVNFDVYRYPRDSSPADSVKRVVANTTTLIGVLGAEYRLPKLPFTISGDIKKGFFGFTNRGAEKRFDLINGLRPSISFRYIFPK